MRTLFVVVVAVGLLIGAPQRVAAAFDPMLFLGAAAEALKGLFVQSDDEQPMEEEQNPEDFVDPKEIQRVTMEIKNMKKEISRLSKQIKKLPNSADDVNQMNVIMEQLSGFQTRINSGQDVRDALQEFYDEQIWEQINLMRAKVEVPLEIGRWNKEIKRAEKSLSQKKFQVAGLDIARAQQKLQEVKNTLAQVESSYNAGDLETAIQELDDVRQEFHPGEIMATVQRMQELYTRLKRVKDAAIKTQIQDALSEVVTEFNDGEYRAARELLDETWPEIMKIVGQATAPRKKGVKQGAVQPNVGALKEQLREKAENIRMKQEEAAKQREAVAPMPAAPAGGPAAAPAPAPSPTEASAPVQAPTQ